MPRDLGDFHVIVNVPEFMVRVVEDGTVVHETRVIVGKPTNPTPIFSNAMSHLIVNPYWNVPASIISKEMMPEIRNDPYGYFARQGYEVFVRVGGKLPTGRSALDRLVLGRSARTCRSARSPATSTRSAASSSCSRISTRSICTTRRRSRCSSAISAPSAMAACAWRTRSISPTRCSPSRRRSGTRRGSKSSSAGRSGASTSTPTVPVHLAYFTDWVGPDGELQPLRRHLRLRRADVGLSRVY